MNFSNFSKTHDFFSRGIPIPAIQFKQYVDLTLQISKWQEHCYTMKIYETQVDVMIDVFTCMLNSFGQIVNSENNMLGIELAQQIDLSQIISAPGNSMRHLERVKMAFYVMLCEKICVNACK